MALSATKEGTEKFFETHTIHPDKKRTLHSLAISAFAMGTYLGDCDEATDEHYENAIYDVVDGGVNFLDTAINYRCQRSERVIGRALKELEKKGISRDQIVISTKGGFVPGDNDPEEYQNYVRHTYWETGILQHGDLVEDCHCMTPRFLESEIETSLRNLDVDCIDLYYLHNPETQLPEIGEKEFDERVRKAFVLFETMVEKQKIKSYGVATWYGFRQKPKNRNLLRLYKFIECAKDIAGDHHHFKAIQLPYNLVMLEAIKQKNQGIEDEEWTILDAAKEFNIDVMTSAPLMQSQVLNLPQRLFDLMPGEESKTQRAMQFVVSTPNINAAMVGMKTPKHVEANLKILQEPDWALDQLKDVWKSLGIISK